MTNDGEPERASAEAHMEFLSLDPGAEPQRTAPTLLSFLNSSSGHTVPLSLEPRKALTHQLLCTDDKENPSIGNNFHT